MVLGSVEDGSKALCLGDPWRAGEGEDEQRYA